MTLDTNILVDYLNGASEIVHEVNAWKEEGRALFVSSISFSEMLALSTLAPQDIDLVRNFMQSFISVPFDNNIAEWAAFIKRKYRLKLPDAAVAATALVNNVPLVTRDKQFSKVKEILVINL